MTKKERANPPRYEANRLKAVTAKLAESSRVIGVYAENIESLHAELNALKKRVRKLLKEMRLSEIDEGNGVDVCPLCQLFRDCETKP